MILTKNVFIKGNSRNISYYRSLGYNIFPKEKIKISVEHLLKGCDVLIEVCCDICEEKKYVAYNAYYKITNGLIEKYHCSNTKCTSLKIKETFDKKYGKHPSKLETTKNKTKETSFLKFGTEHFSKLESTKEQKKEKYLLKLGVNNPSQSDVVKNKKIETSKKNWKVEHPMKNSIVKERCANSHKENYIPPFSDRNFQSYLYQIKKDITFNKYKEILNINNYDVLSINNSELNILHKKCNSNFNINFQNLRNRLVYNTTICTHCYPIGDNKSIKEKELINWIKELDISFIESDKIILNPKHLDVYIPSHNLAIEMNGLYHHSENFKDKIYHLDKSLKCLEQGIQLLHIWEDEWVFKQDIVKSIILNKLGLISNKIYARQCEIRVIEDSKLVREFLDKNHIQGYSQSTIKLGLYYKNELVSLMTFGKRMIKSNVEFELIRFCNKINLNVIGAASKLFNYFKQNYHFTELISYSDFRLFDGSMYQTLGFTKKHLSKPDYFWCKGLERHHRSTFMKHKLVKEGFDKNKTEVEIMHERGYYRIFGCGQYRWLFKNI